MVESNVGHTGNMAMDHQVQPASAFPNKASELAILHLET